MSLIKTYVDKSKQNFKNLTQPVTRPTAPEPPPVETPPNEPPVVEPQPAPILEQAQPKKKSKFSAKSLVSVPALILYIVLFTGVLVSVVIFSASAREMLTSLFKPAGTAVLGNNLTQQEKENGEILQEVGKLIVLPSNEAPGLATITDIDKLKGQDFFKDARNGDQLLVYKIARKAILYRPGEKKIVNITTVSDTSLQKLPDAEPQNAP
jgi:hypothetical protein